MSVDRVVLDTNVFISARNPSEPGSRECRELLERIDRGDLYALVSVVTLGEIRAGFTEAEVPAMFTPFLSHLQASRNYRVENVDEQVAIKAGALRQELSLTLPDTLILATALLHNAVGVVTSDTKLLKTRGPVRTIRPSDL